MLAFFDIENLSSFVRSSKKERFEDCCRMLKMQFDLIFNFPKDRIREYPEIMVWITTMTQGAKGKTSYNDNIVFPPRPLKSNTHKTFSIEQLSAIYLINDERIGLMMNLGVIMYAGVGCEVETLSTLFKDSDYGFFKELPIKKIHGWDDIFDRQALPTTDIIIQDRYILSDETLYEPNLYSLIGKLCQKVQNASVNIIIFSLHSYNSYTPDCGAIRSKIKSIVKRITSQEPKVTFILQRDMRKQHDRIIFTNYQYISSGDSFNYFDSHGHIITGGDSLKIQSVAHRDNFSNAMDFIHKLQSIINKLKVKNSDCILFDKSSCYLTF